MGECVWDQALLRLLTDRERAVLDEAVEAFIDAALPTASAKALNEAAAVFEDEMEDMTPDEQFRGWIFAALLRARAAAVN